MNDADIPKLVAQFQKKIEDASEAQRSTIMRILTLLYGIGTKPLTEAQLAARRAGGLARSGASRFAGKFTPGIASIEPAAPPPKKPAAPPAENQQPASRKPAKAVVSPVVVLGFDSGTKALTTGNNIPKLGERPTEPGVKFIINAYHDEFLRRFGEKPNITGKDAASAKGLIRSHGTEKVREVMGLMFESDDDFIVKAGPSLPILSSQWNKLVANGHQGPRIPDAVRRSMEIAREQ